MVLFQSSRGHHLGFAFLSYPRVVTFRAVSTNAPATRSLEQPSELFEYTLGRWLLVVLSLLELDTPNEYTYRWNDELRHSERRRCFNVSELKRLAAASVNRNIQDVV